MNTLAQESCVAAKKDDTIEFETEKTRLKDQLPEWRVIPSVEQVPELLRTFEFPDYLKGLEFVQKLGQLAEEQDHHPTIILEWRRVIVKWSTHSIRNLHKNDFIMAAKTDELHAQITPAQK